MRPISLNAQIKKMISDTGLEFQTPEESVDFSEVLISITDIPDEILRSICSWLFHTIQDVLQDDVYLVKDVKHYRIIDERNDPKDRTKYSMYLYYHVFEKHKMGFTFVIYISKDADNAIIGYNKADDAWVSMERGKWVLIEKNNDITITFNDIQAQYDADKAIKDKIHQVICDNEKKFQLKITTAVDPANIQEALFLLYKSEFFNSDDMFFEFLNSVYLFANTSLHGDLNYTSVLMNMGAHNTEITMEFFRPMIIDPMVDVNLVRFPILRYKQTPLDKLEISFFIGVLSNPEIK